MASLYVASSKDGWLQGVCKSLDDFSERWFIKHLVAPIIISVPPALIMLAASKDSFRESLPSQVQGFFSGYPFVAILIALVYAISLKGLWAGIVYKGRPKRKVTVEDLVALSYLMEEASSQRMRDCISVLGQAVGARRYERAFSAIAKPEDQYRALVRAAFDFFSTIDRKSNFRVGLMRISGGSPVQWLANSPHGRIPRMSPEDLAVPTSTVSRSIKVKSLIVVEDVIKEAAKKNKEDRNYVKGVAGGEAGSQLCIPVISPVTQNVDFVLCIAAGKSGVFSKGSSDVYAALLAPIVSRLQYEGCLEALSREVENGAQKAA